MRSLVRFSLILIVIQLIQSIDHVQSVRYASNALSVAVIGDFIDQSIKSPLELAISHINEQNILPLNQSINLIYFQSTNQITSTRQFLDYFYQSINQSTSQSISPLIAVISATTDDLITLNIGQITSSIYINIPVIAPMLSSSTSSVGGDYRMLLRSYYSDRDLAKSTYRLIDRYGWQIIAVIYSDDDYGRGFMQSLLSETSINGNMTLKTFSIPASTAPGGSISLTSSSTTQALQMLHESGVRIIILHSSDAQMVIETASLLGMIGVEPYTWIGDAGWCAQSMIRRLPAGALTGAVCVSPNTPQDMQSWTNFTQQLHQYASSHYDTPSHVPIEAGFLYDSLFALSKAITLQSNQSVANSGATLLACLLRTRFEGVTGPFQYPALSCSNFPSSCTLGTAGLTDRISNFILVNYHSDEESFQPVGSFRTNLSTGAYELIVPDESRLVWSDGTSEAILDRPDVYTYGKQVSVNTDIRILVLSYAIAAFGAWCANIMLEQAVSSKQQWHSSRSQPLTIKTREFAVTRVTWLAWTASAALALSTCSVWAVSYLNISAISLHTVTTYISSLPFALSLIYNWLMIYGALLMMLQTVRAKDNKSGIESSLVDSSRKSGTQASLLSRDETQNETSVSSSSQKRRRRILEGTLTYKLMHIVRSLSLWNAASSALVALVVITQQVIAINSLNGGFSFSEQIGTSVGAAFMILCLVWIPLVLMYHLFNSNYRVLAPFVFAAIAFGGDMIAFSGTKFYYMPDHRESSYHQFEVDFMSQIFIALACLVLCFGLMSLNIWYLRQTRKLIDRVVSQVEQQIRKSQSLLAEEKAILVGLEQHFQQDAKILEAMSFCRPHYRPYSLAFVLADHKMLDHDDPSATKNIVSAMNGSKHTHVVSTTLSNESSHPSNQKRTSTNSIDTTSLVQSFDLFSMVHVAKNETQLLANLQTSESKVRIVDARLSDVLQHPIGLSMLSDVAISRFTPENIYLYSIIEKYRTTIEPRSRAVVATEIDRLFIRQGASHQVNIDSYMRDGLIEALKQEMVTPSMFDAVSQEIQRLTSTNYWDTWFKSPFFKQTCMLMQTLPVGNIGPNSFATMAISPSNGSRTTTKPKVTASKTKNTSSIIKSDEQTTSPLYQPRSSIASSRVAPRPNGTSTPTSAMRNNQRVPSSKTLGLVTPVDQNTLNTPQRVDANGSPHRSNAASTRLIINRIALDSEFDQHETEPVVPLQHELKSSDEEEEQKHDE